MLKLVINSIWAGLMISIGAVTYLNCPSQIAGAFLFSIGLSAILMLRFNLYTGLVGNAKNLRSIPELMVVILGNAIGAFFSAAFAPDNAISLWQTKLNKPLDVVFIQSIVCGILMYIAVYAYKKLPVGNNLVVMMLAVASFILSGAEHSIADMCFMFAARAMSFTSLGFIMVVIAGNTLGSIILGAWMRHRG